MTEVVIFSIVVGVPALVSLGFFFGRKIQLSEDLHKLSSLSDGFQAESMTSTGPTDCLRFRGLSQGLQAGMSALDGLPNDAVIVAFRGETR